MNEADRSLLSSLLHAQRVLSLAVLADGAPYAGLLPFAVAADGSLLVLASSLARHTSGLVTGAPVAALIHAPDDPAGSAFEIPRLSITGTAEHLPRGTAAFDEGRGRYLSRFADARELFEFADFELYALRPDGGRLVGGFARAVDVGRDDLAAAAGTRP